MPKGPLRIEVGLVAGPVNALSAAICTRDCWKVEPPENVLVLIPFTLPLRRTVPKSAVTF